MKIGIIGAGSIAAIIPNTCCKLKEAEAYAVASRSLEKAEAFAKKYGIPKAYGCYEDLLKDKDVDLVYIPPPISHNFRHFLPTFFYFDSILPRLNANGSYSSCPFSNKSFCIAFLHSKCNGVL